VKARRAMSLAWAMVCAGLSAASGCAESHDDVSESRAAASSARACGEADQPDCPLQGWMKSTLQAYMIAGDTERMARAFDELAEHAPPGYATWKAEAEAGARAARRGDLNEVRAQCKVCHDANRSRYRRELRTRNAF
jgi:hypothetical protein